MASGKTTFGRAAAALLGRRFADTDHLLQERYGRPAGELFTILGEEAFRRAEEQILSEALASESDLILALGGGTVKSRSNRTLLRERAEVIWLQTSIDIIMSEIGNCDRPLVKGKSREEVEALYEKRKPLYESVADYVFRIETTDYDNVIKELADFIRTIPSL